MVEGMSTREASRVCGLHLNTVRKMVTYSLHPGYRWQSTPRRPNLEPFTGVIDGSSKRTSGIPKSRATRPSASSRGSGTSTGSTASTPSSRTTLVLQPQILDAKLKPRWDLHLWGDEDWLRLRSEALPPVPGGQSGAADLLPPYAHFALALV